MPGPKLYLPVRHPIAQRDGMITREWLMQEQNVVDVIFAAGDVSGPPSVGAAGNIAVFSSTTGKVLADGGFTILQVIQEARNSYVHDFLFMG